MFGGPTFHGMIIHSFQFNVARPSEAGTGEMYGGSGAENREA